MHAEQSDITQQREQLYRRMELLTNQGLLISPNTPLPVTTAHSVQHEEISPPDDTVSCPTLISPPSTEHSMSTTTSAPSLNSQVNFVYTNTERSTYLFTERNYFVMLFSGKHFIWPIY